MNILVVRNDKLGDFITALPAIYLLKKHNKDFKIHVLVAPLNKELATTCSFIDEVIVDDTTNAVTLANKLRPYKIELSFTMFSNTKVALAQSLSSIKTRVAPATKIAQIFYNKRVKQRRSKVEMSEYEYNIELVKSYFSDLNTHFPTPLLHVEESSQIFNNFKNELNLTKDIVVFHPGFGGSSDANLTNEEYFKLIKIASTCSVDVVVTFGPDEKRLYDIFNKEFSSSTVKLYISQDGLINFAALLSHVKLFISTSTGTYHLAALVGTPTFTFFANTLFASVKRWRAISSDHIQHPYMLSKERSEYNKLFKKIQIDLKNVIDDKS
ncbi:MAG: glycosyltransferase family 9 protein [Campylobacterota bacterium]|nr:glycosyltransferase family 9 protein [Campylobacterota bacterium]